MPTLPNYPIAKQATANSCWAAAGRSINNFYQLLGKSGTNPAYASDQAFADAWAKKTGNNTNKNINIQQSASAALWSLKFKNNTDSAAVPTKQEITDAINANQPLLAIVGDAPPNPNPNTAYQNGHWVVIIGINGSNISVFDPDDGKVHTVAYNAATYTAGSYWQNTSYVDGQ